MTPIRFVRLFQRMQGPMRVHVLNATRRCCDQKNMGGSFQKPKAQTFIPNPTLLFSVPTMPMPTICTYARRCLSRRRRVYLWSAALVETRPPALSPPCRCIVPTRLPTVLLSWTGEDGGASSSSASSTIGPRRASPSVGQLAGAGLFSNCICLMDGGGLV